MPVFCVDGHSSESADQINAPNRQLVYRWEAGKRSPGPFYRERLCQVFKMTAEELGLVELTVPDLANAAGTVAGRLGWRDQVASRGVV